MALDKVVDSAALDAAIKATANAIRAKTGSADKIPWDNATGFQNAVAAITGGGGGVTHDDIATGAISGDIVLSASSVRSGAFWGCGDITSVTAPNVVSIGTQAFRNCESMESIYAPEVTTIGSYGVAYCYALKSMNFPKLTTLDPYGFTYCTNVEGDLVFPLLEEAPQQGFIRMYKIKSIDLPVCTSIRDQVFRYCYELDTIILRSPTVVSLANTNSFNNMPFASGNTGGKLYVPAAVVDSYKAASRWSTILGYATNEVRALEDYTVDGTVTGALDKTKI